MKTIRKNFQQGDILGKPIRTIPRGAVRVKPGKRGVILAKGEHSGHAHRIADTANCELFELDLRKFVNIRGPVQLTHEEHHTQTIEPGVYEIGIVREYDYLADMERPVVD